MINKSITDKIMSLYILNKCVICHTHTDSLQCIAECDSARLVFKFTKQ